MFSFGGGCNKRFSPFFHLFFENPQLFFLDIERGALDLPVPGRGDHIHEPFLLNPEGAESEGYGTKIFTQGQLEKNGFMIRGVNGKDFRGGHKIKSQERGLDEESIKASSNVAWAPSFVHLGEFATGGLDILQLPI